MKLLENSGADVNAADEHGMTPLHKAAVQGHADTVAELLAHGAHIDAKLTVIHPGHHSDTHALSTN